MMEHRPGLVIRWLLVAIAVTGCVRQTTERTCAPGAVQRCACLGAPDGVQKCADDGSRWGSCECLAAVPVGTEDVGTPGAPLDAGPVAEVADVVAGVPEEAGSPDGVGDGEDRPKTVSERQVAVLHARIENLLSLENVLASADTTEVQPRTGTAEPPPVVQVTPVEPPAPPARPRGVVRTSGGTPVGGEGRMSGDVFRASLGRKRAAIQICYDNALATNATLAGVLTFLVTINQRGEVAVVPEQTDAALDAAGVTNCVRAKLGTMNFSSSPPQGGDFRIRLPISFAPGE